MTDSEFDALTDLVLEQVGKALETSALEVNAETKGEGVLEIEFADGSKMIINRHRAAREIWVAARAGGFHFRWDGAAWRDTRNGTELYAALSKLASVQGGAAVVLSAPRPA
jgi:CyaY protein